MAGCRSSNPSGLLFGTTSVVNNANMTHTLGRCSNCSWAVGSAMMASLFRWGIFFDGILLLRIPCWEKFVGILGVDLFRVCAQFDDIS